VNKKNFTKTNFIKNLNVKTGLSVQICKKLINDFLEILIQSTKDDEFNLKNIGSLRLIKKKERLGRNPKTKEEHVITSRKSISFTASKKLLKNLN
jgi:integration host factor subunit alpha